MASAGSGDVMELQEDDLSTSKLAESIDQVQQNFGGVSAAMHQYKKEANDAKKNEMYWKEQFERSQMRLEKEEQRNREIMETLEKTREELFQQRCHNENLRSLRQDYTSLKAEYCELERKFCSLKSEVVRQLKYRDECSTGEELNRNQVEALSRQCAQLLQILTDWSLIDELPLEMVVMKTVIKSCKEEQTTRVRPGMEMLTGVVSVNSRWRNVVLRLVGRPSSKRRLKMTMDYYGKPCRRWLRAPRQLKVVNRKVRSLAKLDEHIYVICDSDQLMVYDVITLQLTKEQKLPWEVRPTDFGACSKNHCLYLSDCMADVVVWKIIERIGADENESQYDVNIWYSLYDTDAVQAAAAENGENGHNVIRSLSVIGDGRVALLICKVEQWYDRASEATRCDILTDKAVVQASVAIVDQIVNPLCLLHTNRNTFLIIRHNGISEVGGEGRVVNEFTDSQLTMPVSFEADTVSDTMFVADRVSGKLFLMKQDLRVGLQKLLIDLRDAKQNPSSAIAPASNRNFARVFHDCRKRQLIVGYNNGEIELYD